MAFSFLEVYLLEEPNVIFWLLFPFLFLPFWNLSAISNELHGLCLEHLNFQTPWKDIYTSLVCGKRLGAGSLKNTFVQGGLIHLTVVSGAHLLFLEKLWKRFPWPSFIKTNGLFCLLICYALTSRLQAPVLRALFSFCLFRFSHSQKLFWNPNLITLLSGLFCLLYQPAWINSFSLQLSLLACLLLHFSTSPIKKCFFVYLFILPIINRWQSLHPFTVLINWIFAPVISGLLFPLSFLSPFFPFLYPLTDSLWSFAIQILKFLEFLPSQSPLLGWSLPKNWIWFYIAFISLLNFIIHKIKNHRELYVRKAKPENPF